MKIKFLSTLCLLILFSIISLGQSISGKITDKKNNPIANAYIINKVNYAHTHSDSFGKFEISGVSKGDTLVVSHIKFEKIILILSERHFQKDLRLRMEFKYFELGEVMINGNIKSLNLVSEIDIQTKAVSSSQEILRNIPGLIIGQHAGGGKAEQIFLRGFDIDHGTDINIAVDGMPVNMVSHAHGQGYADLHFLIPEIVNSIDFGKGPYYADKGNFTTGGYVEFNTKDKLLNSDAKIEYGEFNTIRTYTGLNIINSNKQSAYLAGDFLITDGPFESSQKFNRINLFGKYTSYLNQYDKISISTSYFTSKWDASGQIPQRAVNSGLISRFGAIDDTEGGLTSRANINVNYFKFINKQTFVKSKLFFSNYNFELYSNFTFFLHDSINGDQIRQKENREIFGAESEINRIFNLENMEVRLKAAGGFRNDISKNNELSHTKNRKITINRIKLGDIYETNIYGYFNVEFNFNKWLINPAVRLDYFNFNYIDLLSQEYKSLAANKTTFSPKFNIIYNQSENVQLFLKSGIGFHSNDTRVVLANNEKDILPLAFGSDLGTITRLSDKIILNASLWYLFLEQELVYVGDEGIVEPSGRTERKGVDFGVRYQLTKHLFFDNDVSYAFARSLTEATGQNYIPLAPDITNTGGLSLVKLCGFSGGIYYRYIGNRPAVEDNSIIAKGYFITDMNFSYNYKNIEFGIMIKNLFNNKWKETQFATETRLQNEIESVEEIHFTPGTPFFAKIKFGIKF